jgi:DNA-binding NarL/FixJ family response regulator
VIRVLLGDFEAIVRLGLWNIFAESGELVTEESSTTTLVDRLVDIAPDVVMLDLDASGVADLARTISIRFPTVTVIACSSATPRMRIYPPFHTGEYYTTTCDLDALMAVIRGRD